MKSVFLSKYTLRFFTALIFSSKNHGLQKNSFSIDYVKLTELYVVYT